jgi:hypothetical protein
VAAPTTGEPWLVRAGVAGTEAPLEAPSRLGIRVDAGILAQRCPPGLRSDRAAMTTDPRRGIAGQRGSAQRSAARSSAAVGNSMSRRSVNSRQYTALMISATGA